MSQFVKNLSIRNKIMLIVVILILSHLIASFFRAIYTLDVYFVILSLAIEVAIGLTIGFYLSRLIAKPAIELTVSTNVVASGDLTTEVQVTSTDEFGRLASAFKSMTESLRKVVGRILEFGEDASRQSEELAASTEQINSTVQQVATTIQEISKGTQSQAQQLDEVNKISTKFGETVQELVSKANKVSESASSVVQAAGAAGEYADQGSQAMTKITRISEESGERVRRLAETTSQITSVLEVIRKIADQTNL
ncbi:MAG: methyl-accepting chemotaxis protein, partial [Thaumarchaeota archaeon]|nr:methyl-accepting chemotaxis protein [Nitrososphaerota archaeon]